jgi:hypothetical protein
MQEPFLDIRAEPEIVSSLHRALKNVQFAKKQDCSMIFPLTLSIAGFTCE